MLSRKGWRIISIIIVLSISLLVISCSTIRRPKVQDKVQPSRQPSQQTAKKPSLPKPIRTGKNKEPKLKVYIVQEKKIKEMAFEDYVAGVVGGEIKNDWPEESIKAQAIIARTFVLQFIQEKGQSKYKNAHVSTDIEEAQAWNTQVINDRVRKAVNDTKGQVIVYNGQFAKTWFHSNAGGKTATAKEGLNYKGKNPPYIQVVDSPDTSDAVDKDAKSWSTTFTRAKVITALKDVGKSLKSFSSVSIGEKGPSGRAMTIRFDKTDVNAAELRLALGSTDMKSTLLDKITLEGNQVVMSGRGYGHGVGMSQWGAFSMANNGKSAKDIINHYFKDINIVKMWD